MVAGLTRSGRTAVVSVLLIAVGVFAASAQARPTELLVRFMTADRNIECLMVDPNTTIGNIECVLHSKGYTKRGDSDNHALTARPHPAWSVDYSQAANRQSTRREVNG